MNVVEGLYPTSIKLIASRSHWFVEVVAHDPNDAESSDLLWLTRNAHNELCEGEVVKLSPLREGRWFAAHDYADTVGGWPTVWDTAGTESEVVEAVLAYLEIELPDVLARA